MRCSTKSVWYLTWVLLCLDITYSSMNNRHFEGSKLWTVKMRTRAPFVDGVAAGYTGGRTNFHTSSLLAGASDAVRWSVKHLIWSTLSLSQVRFFGSNYFCPFWVSRYSFFFSFKLGHMCGSLWSTQSTEWILEMYVTANEWRTFAFLSR